MKKSLLLAMTLFASLSFAAKEETGVKPGEVEKKGFLATEWCLKNDYFKDCRLDSTQNSPLALYVHGEGKIYKLDISDFHAYEMDEGVAKNNVSIIGKLENGVIKVREYKAPPPEGQSFFKGCL